MAIKRTQQGFSLLLAIVVTSVALTIALSLLTLTLKQIDLSASVRDSETAFQLAATGLECAINIRQNESDDVESGIDLFDNNWCPPSLETFSLSEKLDPPDTGRYRYDAQFDVGVPTGTGVQNRCVEFEFFIVNDAASNRTLRFTSQSGEELDFDGRSCPAGDICTIATARGYNTSCNDLNNPFATLLQREITAEF